MTVLIKILMILGFISQTNDESTIKSLEKNAQKTSTLKELKKNNQLTEKQYQNILEEIALLEEATEEQKQKFYKKMLKDAVFISGPEMPCKDCP